MSDGLLGTMLTTLHIDLYIFILRFFVCSGTEQLQLFFLDQTVMGEHGHFTP
jgi:hypothetical protein